MKAGFLPILLWGCAASADIDTGATEAVPISFTGKAYAPLQGKDLEAVLAGKQLKYEYEDGLGHARIPFHGPENFGLQGEYSFKAHRGWIEKGKYWVRGAEFCVKLPKDDSFCRHLYRANDGQFLVVDDSPWPVQLLSGDNRTSRPECDRHSQIAFMVQL